MSIFKHVNNGLVTLIEGIKIENGLNDELIMLYNNLIYSLFKKQNIFMVSPHLIFDSNNLFQFKISYLIICRNIITKSFAIGFEYRSEFNNVTMTLFRYVLKL